ncbi:hypothetical protein KR009_002184 [Drosophila setifemur]|nr:hypothetical protein KR009_002184 [Drosophila setifemur]
MGNGTKIALSWLSVVGLIAVGVGLAHGDAPLRCYQCSESDISCGSNRNPYGKIVECGNSTMCTTTVITKNLLDGKEWHKTLRDCARQVKPTMNLVKRKWVEGFVVDPDLYQEGCSRLDTILYCYCTGSLCNSSSSPILDLRLILLLIFVGKLLLPV